MTIFEYLKNPHPWFDTNNYTLTQIVLFFTGSMLWLVCYLDTLRDIRNKKVVNIPAAAVILNFGWEMAACFFFVPNMGKLLVAAYWAWMLCDVFIFYSLFRYGFKQMRINFFRSHAHYFIISGIIISFLSQCTFMIQYDLPMAPITGYIINLIMSVAFLYLLFIPDFNWYSRVTAWSKFLGTGIISIMFFTKYPANNFLTVMYLAVAAFDILYIILVYKKLKGLLPISLAE
ncbi:MAG TPA: hypothetical protein VI385_12795 [Flavisolibacter sp.]